MRSFFAEGQIKVDGETLHLVCNFRAIDCIESLTGMTMPNVLSQLAGEDIQHSLSGKVLWGLLREKHEGVTLDEAAGVGFGPNGKAIWLVVGDVIARAYNFGEEEKGKNPPMRRGRSRSSAKSG